MPAVLKYFHYSWGLEIHRKQAPAVVVAEVNDDDEDVVNRVLGLAVSGGKGIKENRFPHLVVAQGRRRAPMDITISLASHCELS